MQTLLPSTITKFRYSARWLVDFRFQQMANVEIFDTYPPSRYHQHGRFIFIVTAFLVTEGRETIRPSLFPRFFTLDIVGRLYAKVLTFNCLFRY